MDDELLAEQAVGAIDLGLAGIFHQRLGPGADVACSVGLGLDHVGAGCAVTQFGIDVIVGARDFCLLGLQGQATLFQFQSAEFVLVAFFASTLALFLGGLHLALLGGALLGSTLCRGLLLACGGLTGVGALLCGGGLAQALGFGSGFGLLGLLLDLIQLVELCLLYTSDAADE